MNGYIPRTYKMNVKPLFNDSSLFDGLVVVEAKIETKYVCEKKQFISKEYISSDKDDIITTTKMTKYGLYGNDGKNNNFSRFQPERLSTYLKNKPKSYEIPNGTICFLTFVGNFNSVYVAKANEVSNTGHYELYNYGILLNIGKDLIPEKNPTVGDNVKVFTPEFGTTYRAKILKNNPDGTFDVSFIDYGNTVTVESNVIFKLDDDLQMPGLAMKVGINDLKNYIFTEEINNMFEDLIEMGKTFMIEYDIKSENCLENVKLRDMESGSYVDINYIEKHLNKKLESSNKFDLPMGEDTELLNDHNIKLLNHLKNNDTVFLKHFDSMTDVYIIKDIKLFDNVMLKLTQDKSFVPKTNINIGDIVKVASVDSHYYRGKVIDINVSFISIQNIDIGFVEIVEANTIGELSNELRQIPGLLFKIGIKGPLIQKSDLLKCFINENEKVPLYLEFDEFNSNRYQEITLKRKDNSENIIEDFIKNYQLPFFSGISNNNLNQGAKHSTKKSSSKRFKSISLENGDYCFVSFFEDFKNIYVCKAVPSKNNPDLYEIHNKDIIERTKNTKDFKIQSNLAIGDIVKVVSSYGHFCRGEIISIENDKCQVFCIDFGNTEIFHLSDIFELSDDLKIVTNIPLRVSIEVPPNSKINDEIRHFFTNIIADYVTLSIEYNKKSKNYTKKVFLKEVVSGKSVNKEVLKSLSNEKISIQNSTYILTWFEDIDTIFVVNKLDNIKMREDLACTDHIPVINLTTGDAVKVFSPSFRIFCRAKIIDIKNNCDCFVFYCDYGSTEIVSPSQIYKLPDYLKKKPNLAIQIGLSMPFSVKVNEQISNLFLELVSKTEPLHIEFDKNSENGLKKGSLKVISSGLKINNEIIKLSSNQSYVSPKIDSLRM